MKEKEKNTEDESELEMLMPPDYPSNLKIEIVESSNKTLFLTKIAATTNYRKAQLIRPLRRLIEVLTKSPKPEDTYKSKVFEALDKVKSSDDIADGISKALLVNPNIYGLNGVSEDVITDINEKATDHFILLELNPAASKKLADLRCEGIRAKHAEK